MRDTIIGALLICVGFMIHSYFVIGSGDEGNGTDRGSRVSVMQYLLEN